MNKKMINKFGTGLFAGSAMLLSAMLASGCSDSKSDLMAGGVSEDLSFGKVKLVGSVQAVGKILQESNDKDSSAVEGEVTTYPFVPKTIEFCTLDSLTFALADSCETFDLAGKTSYELNVESTGWRYGLLSVQGDPCEDCDEDEVSYQAIIDKNDPTSSNVNILTTWKYDQVKKLVASGVNVDEAMARSEGDVLALLGIYGEYTSFGQMNLSGTTKSDAVLVAATYLLPNPASDKSIIDAVYSDLRHNYLGNDVFWLMMGIAQPDEDFAGLVEKYVANYMSVYFELGRCDNEKEGRALSPDTFDFGKFYPLMLKSELNLKCEDGLWIWDAPKMEHEMGSMTDSRDGHVYKTTSFTVNGKTQTWMAEDLSYELPGSKCSAVSLGNCKNLGRIYTWPNLMQLDTTGFIWENPEKADVQNYTNIDECIAKERIEMRDVGIEQDSLMAYKACVGLDLKVDEMVASIEPQNHQGICPDGWRIPSVKDWNLLVEYVGYTEYLGIKLMKDDAWRGSMVRVAGVGKRLVYRRTSDAIDFSAVPNDTEKGYALYASIPSFEEADKKYNLDGSTIEFGMPQPIGHWELFDYFTKDEITDEMTYSSVRCIKAE